MSTLLIVAMVIIGVLLFAFFVVSLALTTLTLWTMWREDRFRYPEGKPSEDKAGS